MEYKHFSHEHNLVMHQVRQGHKLPCSGCQSYCHDSVYACHQCEFFLHEHCGNANRYLKHPSDTLHPLTLFPYPTYTTGSFLCDACGQTGNAFSYSCAICEVDLHIQCAFMPVKVTHKAHQHEMKLYTAVVDPKGPPEFCKICNKYLDSKLWSYSCADCGFVAHTFCGTNEVKPGLFVDDS